MKHTKDIGGHVVLHTQAVEMINEATANGLGKEDIQHNFCDAVKFVFKENVWNWTVMVSLACRI